MPTEITLLACYENNKFYDVKSRLLIRDSDTLGRYFRTREIDLDFGIINIGWEMENVVRNQ